ncbi:hypothetical protein PP175_06525 [Aneurinibacillus sp. Ricciae_BoGa-3]|uniref:hypothetical protein n=1 Tax=Aneurinibacillus sp. Ricciae_BoGa-3 TaxID=3022697 RepID=UPI0023410B53|nr:hypothetical protein [Aneurinibacillus sp. Ricciae_BoGa-3]WCK55595.1 hypothetical protein PP175_06525 [Aneurinibacillus sp. Ricciae_BoGa-3]
MVLIEKKLTKVDSQSFNGIKGTIHLKESPVEPVEFPNRNENMDDSLNLKRSTQINFNNRFVQGLDGASNSTCDIYEVSDTDFKKLFGKNLILKEKEIPIIDNQFWTASFYIKPVDKKLIQRLDGILVT